VIIEPTIAVIPGCTAVNVEVIVSLLGGYRANDTDRQHHEDQALTGKS